MVESFKCGYMKDGDDLVPPHPFHMLCTYHDKPEGKLLSVLRNMNDFCSKCEVFLKTMEGI